MGIYDELGVRTLVNCAGTYTIIGGSKMSETSLAVMNEAARNHVMIRELQQKVHEQLALLTNNECARVTAGAMAGLYIAVATSISNHYGRPLRYISKSDISNCEVIIHRAHRYPYDRGLEILGVRLVEIGYPNNIDVVSCREFEYSFSKNTVAVVFLPSCNGGWVPSGALDFENVIAISNAHHVPVIVDAAAQLPPKSNLWTFTAKGASAVCFSGGKDLRGPQTTGLVLGHKNFIEPYFDENNFPTYGIGRMHKVGREELVGLYSAVKEYISKDEDAFLKKCEKIVKRFVDSFSVSDPFMFERAWPNEAGQPLCRARLLINQQDVCPSLIRDMLMASTPSIFTMVENNFLYINPQMITEEEASLVLGRLKEISEKLRHGGLNE